MTVVSRTMSDVPYITLLGVKIHRVDMSATLALIREYIASGKPHIIVTADASSVVRAQNDAEFQYLINAANLVTPDGFGVIKAADMLGTPLIERVSGVEIAKELCRMSAEEGFSVYFLGAAPGVAELAAQNLKKRFPALQVAGVHDGYFDASKDSEIVAQVKASGAHALLVAMGIPRQEKFIYENMQKLGVCVAMGVGGSFDVFSGKVKRAPEWYQKHGLEWFYRLVKDPTKIKKAATLPKFAAMVICRRIMKASFRAK